MGRSFPRFPNAKVIRLANRKGGKRTVWGNALYECHANRDGYVFNHLPFTLDVHLQIASDQTLSPIHLFLWRRRFLNDELPKSVVDLSDLLNVFHERCTCD